MRILRAAPDAVEICVEQVKPLRFAERRGSDDAFFSSATTRWPPRDLK